MRRQTKLRAGSTLAWAVGFFVAIQVGTVLLIDGRHPELYDPEYGLRLALLRQRQAEQPGRPLLLLLGSSRTVVSFRPEILPPLGPGDRSPLVFNFSHCGAGPLMNLMILDRLLRDGVRPDYLVVEILPPKLFHEGPTLLISTAAGARDLPLLGHFLPAGKVYGRYLLERIISCRRLQLGLVGEYAPDMAIRHDARSELGMDRLGGCSWLLSAISGPERERQRLFCLNQWSWIQQECLIAPESDRATRALLERCHREGIRVGLVLSPEGRAFQDLYSPQGRAELDRYCTELARGYGVPLMDARGWLADGDFIDAHHVLRTGAEAFTRRLAHELLEPLIAGRFP